MSDSEPSPEEELLKRHRKEKKDLQAKIQSMKKGSCKGDKKKKKEITEEIAKLEADLDKRHEEELEALKTTPSGSTVITENLEQLSVKDEEDTAADDSNPQQRVSKAQRRRDKKVQKEKDRLAEIERQDELNQTGARQVEIDKLAALLKARGLTIHEVPSDGDCLYSGIAHQIQVIKGINVAVADLRAAAAKVIRSHQADFLPFMADPATGDMLSPAQFDKYLADLAETKVWGGQLELKALSQHLNCCIEVVQAEGPPTLIGEELSKGGKLILTYHRHMYGLGEHYNSTVTH